MSSYSYSDLSIDYLSHFAVLGGFAKAYSKAHTVLLRKGHMLSG